MTVTDILRIVIPVLFIVSGVVVCYTCYRIGFNRGVMYASLLVLKTVREELGGSEDGK